MYTVETTERFDRQFKKLDKHAMEKIKNWITNHIMNCENPRLYGKCLKADKKGQWRYRIGDYRLLCKIDDNKLIILALSIGHRSSVYKVN